MANSSYYKTLRDQKRKESKNYEKQIKQLQAIRETIESGLDYRVVEANIGIRGLAEDLNDAVRHDGAFSSYVNNELENEAEYPPSRDACLGKTYAALDEEIRNLCNKKNAADNAAQNYDNQYEAEKRREKEEANRLAKEFISNIFR